MYLNVKGREPDGIVDPKYDKIRDEIIKKMQSLKYKGVRPNIKILKKEEAYSNCTLRDGLPDLIILLTDDGVQSIDTNIGKGEIVKNQKIPSKIITKILGM